MTGFVELRRYNRKISSLCLNVREAGEIISIFDLFRRKKRAKLSPKAVEREGHEIRTFTSLKFSVNRKAGGILYYSCLYELSLTHNICIHKAITFLIMCLYAEVPEACTRTTESSEGKVPDKKKKRTDEKKRFTTFHIIFLTVT